LHEVGENAISIRRARTRRDLHHEERRDHREVADGVDPEAPTFADACDEDASDRRPDEARRVHHRRVQGDRVRQVAPVFDHLDDEGLARGHVDRVDEPLQNLEDEHVRHGDRARERERRQKRRLDHREDLRRDERSMAVHPIDPHARERREEERRNLPREADDAEHERRTGEAVHEPARRDAGQPRADERDALAREKEPVVAMSERATEPRPHSVASRRRVRATSTVFALVNARIP
jgi:hypothetical protein